MKRCFILTIILMALCNSFLKAVSFKWALKTGTITSMCTDGADNIYTTGDAPVIKYNSSGKEIMRINASPNDTLTGYGIAVDGKGNIYLCGSFSSTLKFG